MHAFGQQKKGRDLSLSIEKRLDAENFKNLLKNEIRTKIL